jgi:hypothetical protein
VKNRVESDDVVYESKAGEENYLEFGSILEIVKQGVLNINYRK